MGNKAGTKKKKAKKRGTPLTALQRDALLAYQAVTDWASVSTGITQEALMANEHGDLLLSFTVFEAQDIDNPLVLKSRLVKAARQLLDTALEL